MAIGSEQDYLYIPMTPSTAQFIADQLDCSLPTKKLVDHIYNSAEIKLDPQPIPPSDQMTTVPVFNQHTDLVKQQIAQRGFDRTANNIIGGHKKDIIISNKIYSPDRNYERVVIYGWHLGVNNPIQPVYNGHSAMYADYSHGVRYISQIAYVNEDSMMVADILTDVNLSALMSSEGTISVPFYPESTFLSSLKHQPIHNPGGFHLSQNYPNPFNPTTRINYQLAKKAIVDLSIYNILGEKVVTLVSREQPAGNYQVEWDAGLYAGGVYIYALRTDDAGQQRKMILLR
jgi:hypothetical protein